MVAPDDSYVGTVHSSIRRLSWISVFVALASCGVSEASETAPSTAAPTTTSPVAPLLSEPSNEITVALPSTTAVDHTSPPMTIAPAVPTTTSPTTSAVNPLFEPLVETLAAEVGLRVRLPSVVDPPASVDALPPAATLVNATDDDYEIVLGHGDCPGGAACRFGVISGRRLDREEGEALLTEGTRVPLPQGATGVLTPSTCGATCSDTTISWLEPDGTSADSLVVYRMGLTAASGPEIHALAWSALSTDDAPPPPISCGFETVALDGAVATIRTTTLADGRGLHWLTACSDDGIAIELLDSPGTVEWLVDNDDVSIAVASAVDGSVARYWFSGARLTPVS